MKVKRGEIYYVDLGYGNGFEVGKIRPCVILQNDVGNKFSPTTIVVPISHRTKNLGQPTQVVLSKEMQKCYSKFVDGVILGEQVRTVDKNRMKELVGTLKPYAMEEVEKAIRISLGMEK